MKQIAFAVGISILIGLMVLPVSRSVNHQNVIIGPGTTTVADGFPRPIPLPPGAVKVNTGTWMADGFPRPIPLPPGVSGTENGTLVADGFPRPIPLPKG